MAKNNERVQRVIVYWLVGDSDGLSASLGRKFDTKNDALSVPIFRDSFA